MPMTYVYHIWRDVLMNNLILKITQPPKGVLKG